MKFLLEGLKDALARRNLSLIDRLLDSLPLVAKQSVREALQREIELARGKIQFLKERMPK